MNSKKRDGIVPFPLADLFLNLSGLTDSVTQIVKLCSADFTVSHYVYAFNVGAVHREYSFNADALGNASDSLGNDGSFEHLDSLSFPFTDIHVNPHGITDFELGTILFDRIGCDHFQGIHLFSSYFSDIHA